LLQFLFFVKAAPSTFLSAKSKQRSDTSFCIYDRPLTEGSTKYTTVYVDAIAMGNEVLKLENKTPKPKKKIFWVRRSKRAVECSAEHGADGDVSDVERTRRSQSDGTSGGDGLI